MDGKENILFLAKTPVSYSQTIEHTRYSANPQDKLCQFKLAVTSIENAQIKQLFYSSKLNVIDNLTFFVIVFSASEFERYF